VKESGHDVRSPTEVTIAATQAQSRRCTSLSVLQSVLLGGRRRPRSTTFRTRTLAELFRFQGAAAMARFHNGKLRQADTLERWAARPGGCSCQMPATRANVPGRRSETLRMCPDDVKLENGFLRDFPEGDPPGPPTRVDRLRRSLGTDARQAPRGGLADPLRWYRPRWPHPKGFDRRMWT